MSNANVTAQAKETKKEFAWIVVDSNGYASPSITIRSETNNFVKCNPYWSYSIYLGRQNIFTLQFKRAGRHDSCQI